MGYRRNSPSETERPEEWDVGELGTGAAPSSEAPSSETEVFTEWMERQFIPEGLRVAPDAHYRRVRIFFWSVPVLTLVFSTFLSIFALSGDLPDYSIETALLAICIMPLAPLILYATHSLFAAANYAFGVVLFTLVAQSVVDGGLRDPVLLPLMLLPLLAALVLGPRGAAGWAALVVLTFGLLFGVHELGYLHEQHSSEREMYWFQLILGSGVTIGVGALAWAYEAMRSGLDRRLRLTRQQMKVRAQNAKDESARQVEAARKASQEVQASAREQRLIEHEMGMMIRLAVSNILMVADSVVRLAGERIGSGQTESASAESTSQAKDASEIAHAEYAQIIEAQSLSILGALDFAYEAQSIEHVAGEDAHLVDCASAAREAAQSAEPLARRLRASIWIETEGGEGAGQETGLEEPSMLVKTDRALLTRALTWITESVLCRWEGKDVLLHVQTRPKGEVAVHVRPVDKQRVRASWRRIQPRSGGEAFSSAPSSASSVLERSQAPAKRSPEEQIAGDEHIVDEHIVNVETPTGLSTCRSASLKRAAGLHVLRLIGGRCQPETEAGGVLAYFSRAPAHR